MAVKVKFSLDQFKDSMSALEILDVLEAVHDHGKNFSPMFYSLQVSPMPGRMDLRTFLSGEVLPGHLTEVECGLLTHELFYTLKPSRLYTLVEKLLKRARAVHLKFVGTNSPEGYEIKTISITD